MLIIRVVRIYEIPWLNEISVWNLFLYFRKVEEELAAVCVCVRAWVLLRVTEKRTQENSNNIINIKVRKPWGEPSRKVRPRHTSTKFCHTDWHIFMRVMKQVSRSSFALVLLCYCNYVDEQLTPITTDVVVLQSSLFSPVRVYCYYLFFFFSWVSSGRGGLPNNWCLE